MEMTTADLAIVLGISARQIQALEKRGILVKLGHGLWHLPTNVQAWAAHKAQSEVARVGRSPAEERLAAGKAELIELRVMREREELEKRACEESLAVVDDMVLPLKADLYNIIPRVTRDVPLRRRLEVEFDAVFTAAANRSEKKAQTLSQNLDEST